MYNLRGRVISIIDLRSRLGIDPRPDGAAGRVLVVTAGGHTVGIEVDEVSEVFSVDPADLQSAPQQLADTTIVSGILKLEGRLVIIVDIDAWQQGMTTGQKLKFGAHVLVQPYSRDMVQLVPKYKRKVDRKINQLILLNKVLGVFKVGNLIK